MVVLVGIGLVAGFVTAISPCVLPVLPVLLAGGASGRKPLRIAVGLVASFVEQRLEKQTPERSSDLAQRG